MNSFNNEDTFFELTQKAEQEEKDQHLQKCRVTHLWGAAYYNKDEDFKSLIFFITCHLHMKAMIYDIHCLFCTLYLDISLFLANILLIV